MHSAHHLKNVSILRKMFAPEQPAVPFLVAAPLDFFEYRERKSSYTEWVDQLRDVVPLWNTAENMHLEIECECHNRGIAYKT